MVIRGSREAGLKTNWGACSLLQKSSGAQKRKAGRQLRASFQLPNLTFPGKFFRVLQLWKPGEPSSRGRSLPDGWNRPSNPGATFQKAKKHKKLHTARLPLPGARRHRVRAWGCLCLHQGQWGGWYEAVIWGALSFRRCCNPRCSLKHLPCELYSVFMGWEVEASKNNSCLYPVPALVGLFPELWFAPFLCLDYFHFKALCA